MSLIQARFSLSALAANIVNRKRRPVRDWTDSEINATMRPLPGGFDWSSWAEPIHEVVTLDGRLGCAMFVCNGRTPTGVIYDCPPLPSDPIRGIVHRYVYLYENDSDPHALTLAYHVSQLRPFEVATEIN